MITGGSGTDSIDGSAGNQLITGGSGNTTALGGGGDTILGGSGNMNVDIIHPSTVSGAVFVGDNGVRGFDTVTGFSDGVDKIFLGNTQDTVTAVISSASATSAGGIPSTLLTFHSGTAMVLVGIDPSKIDSSDFFKA